VINLAKKIEKKEFTKSKIILFLGAGFSSLIEYPLMNKFIFKLGGNIFEPILDPEEQEFIEVVSILKNTTDLEEIFGILESAIKANYILRKEDFFKLKEDQKGGITFPNYINPTQYRRWVDDFKTSQIEDKVVTICKNITLKIKKEIFKIYRPKEDIDYLVKYGNFFDTILNLAKIDKKTVFIPIFTTNYDVIIEKYFENLNNNNIGIFNFFNSKNEFDPNIIQGKIFNKETIISIMHLHGSIFFYKDIIENKILNTPISSYLEDKRYENKIIYPLKDKTPIEEPFFTYYDYFSRCLDNAKYLIVVGYSFRDSESLNRIKSSLIFNKELKIIIIDSNAYKIKENIFNNSEKIISLNYYFDSQSFKDIIYKDLIKNIV